MIAVGIILGYKMNDKAEMSFITPIDNETSYPIGRVEEILRYIDAKYVDQVDTDSLSDLAIHAIVDALDPHSIYLSPKEIASVNETMVGKFKGIGIESIYLNDTVNIVHVLDGGPAQKAGLEPFDQIIYIDDSLVAGQDLLFDDIRALLRKKDDATTLKIKRQGKQELIALNITLEEINVNSSEFSKMLDDSIGYIQVEQFTEHTYKDFMSSLEVLHDSMGMKHLIIDLRDNPGGVLPQVTKIINQLFNEKGRLIVYTQGEKNNKTEYKTNGKNFFPVDEIVVLINENSASASEILAGVIQDWDRGTIIGRRSYGKGLVQEQYDLSNGGAIRLTVAKYFTPAGRSIQRDYSKRNLYENDLQNRLDNGYLTDVDTIKHSEPIKSLVLKRDIFSNNGITPDVFIPADDLDYNTKGNRILSYAYEYTFTRLKQNPSLTSFEAFPVEEITVDDFKSYVQSKRSDIDLSNLSDELKSSIEKQLKFSYISITKGRVLAQETMLFEDPFIIKSIEHIRSDKGLLDLNS
jgi:carboxyl-terminal processing protease